MKLLPAVVRADLVWLALVLVVAALVRARAPRLLRLCQLAAGWVCVEILFHWYMEEGVALVLVRLGL